MIVRITANLTDPTAKHLYKQFHEEGYAPWGNEEILMGFVRDAVLTPKNYVITVDVTNPQAIDYIYSLPREKDRRVALRSRRTACMPASVRIR